MAFRFRLEKVLRYRQRLVDQQSRLVGEAARKVAGIDQNLQNIQREILLLLKAAQRPGQVRVDDLVTRQSWFTHLENLKEKLNLERAEALLELSREREKLTTLWRGLKVLEQLKVSQKETWNHEQARRESLILDEIGQIRADRQQREKVALTQEHDAAVTNFQSPQ